MESESLETSIKELNQIKEEPEEHFLLILPPFQENQRTNDIKIESIAERTEIKTKKYLKTQENQVECQICLKKLKRNSLNSHNLRMHEIDHENKKKIHCDLCAMKFNYKWELPHHMWRHRETKRFNCEFCSRGFNFKRDYKEHLLTHDDPRPFKCDLCPKDFKRKGNLRDHILGIHDKESWFACDKCDFKTKSRSILAYHRMKHNGKKFKCSQCDKKFPDRQQLKQHEITHLKTRNFECSLCSNKFKSLHCLRVHENRTHSTKKFNCDQCVKTFKHRGSLKKHQEHHSDDKKIDCSTCSKSFVTKNLLNIHKKYIHGPKTKCQICSREMTRYNLKRHMKTHESKEIKETNK